MFSFARYPQLASHSAARFRRVPGAENHFCGKTEAG